ncbi:MAG: hypothetical protein HC863_01965 [Myxococcales bacterium]|nr:hypothetical protein [Myxococcales bacterium]
MTITTNDVAASSGNGNAHPVTSIYRETGELDQQLLSAIVEQAIASVRGGAGATALLPRPVSRSAAALRQAKLPRAVTDRDATTTEQRELEHVLLRSLVEAPEQQWAHLPFADQVFQLRELCQSRQLTPPNGASNRAAETVLMTFAVKAITEALAAIISGFDFLRHPAVGHVSWYNDTDGYVHVMTFDQDDAVRWVRYEERVVAPKQVVLLTARGQLIHIKTMSNNATYDCQKGQSYLFNGTNCYPRLS